MDGKNNPNKKSPNKTINLEDKKQQKESYKSASINKNTENANDSTSAKNISLSDKQPSKTNTKQDKKVISYGISKKKKKAKSVIFKNKFTLLIIIAVSIFCFISYSIKSNLPASKNTSSEFVSIDPKVDKDDFNRYSSIIGDSVQSILKFSSDDSIITETMHKNGYEILAQGYFIWEGKKKVYFDITLQGDKATSLLINGKEYVK